MFAITPAQYDHSMHALKPGSGCRCCIGSVSAGSLARHVTVYQFSRNKRTSEATLRIRTSNVGVSATDRLVIETVVLQCRL